MENIINFLSDLKKQIQECDKLDNIINIQSYKKIKHSHYQNHMIKLYDFEIKYYDIIDLLPDSYLESIVILQDKEKEIIEKLKQFNDENDKSEFSREMLWDVYEPLVIQIHTVAYKSVYNYIAKNLVLIIKQLGK